MSKPTPSDRRTPDGRTEPSAPPDDRGHDCPQSLAGDPTILRPCGLEVQPAFRPVARSAGPGRCAHVPGAPGRFGDVLGLRQRAEWLRLHGLLAHWNDARDAGWAATLGEWKEQERARRSLERRLKDARIGRFKTLADFDWSWPTRCDRAAIDALMGLDFLKDAGNAVVVGPNGVGKSTIARNVAHHAVLAGHTALFTTNRPFSEWHEVFTGAACVVSMVDRLVHNAEVIAIDGDSYRLKEATERADQRARKRKATNP